MATTTTKAAAAATAKADDVVNETFDAASKATAEVPAPVREFAEKSVQQAKENYSRLKSVAEEASDALEDAYATASKGYKDLGRKSVELARTNVNAHFDFLHALIGAKTVSQAVELQTAYAKQQFDTISGQVKELSAIAQKATSEGAKPFQDLAAKGLRYGQAR